MSVAQAFGEYDWCQHIDIRVAPEDWIVNRKTVPAEDFFYLAKLIEERSDVCPYCSTIMVQGELPEGVDSLAAYIDKNDDVPEWFLAHSLELCLTCGFWTASYTKERGRFGMRLPSYAAAVKRVFPLDAPNAPMSELREYLRRHPKKLTEVNATVFEQLVGDIFKDTWGEVDVTHVGQTNDGGIDLVLVRSEEERWLVQCKRRRSLGATEGVRTVRELLGSLLTEGELRGIVVSTADHFSYEAKKLAEHPHLVDLGYQIELCDFGVLRELMCGSRLGPTPERAGEQTARVPVEGPWASFFTNPWRAEFTCD